MEFHRSIWKKGTDSGFTERLTCLLNWYHRGKIFFTHLTVVVAASLRYVLIYLFFSVDIKTSANGPFYFILFKCVALS